MTRITRVDSKYDFTVEVETSSKNSFLISESLASYERTLARKMQCAGVIYVCCDQNIYNSFRAKIEKLPPEIERRVVLIQLNEINQLEERFYGRLGMRPNQGLNYMRNSSPMGIKYFPIISREDEFKSLLKGGHYSTHTRNNNEVKV